MMSIQTRTRTTAILLALSTLALGAIAVHAQNQGTIERAVGTEELLEVTVEGGFGKVLVHRTSTDRLYTVTQLRGQGDAAIRPQVRYSVSGTTGTLHIDLTGVDEERPSTISCIIGSSNTPRWDVAITDRIPVRLHVEVGAGESNLDLTGMRIRDLSIESGAGTTLVRSSQPNQERLRRVTIEAGLGSLRSEHLGNLGFESLRFEGGMGTYVLDLSGEMRDGASVTAELGVGSMSVLLPAGVGVSLRSEESWFTTTKLTGFTRSSDSYYESADIAKAAKHMSMRLDSGMGSVRIGWK